MKHNLLTTQGIMNHSVEHFSEREAFSFLDEQPLTYGDVGKAVSSLQYFLEQLNIKQGDKVAIFSANMPNWSISYFAIASMGAVVVPILPDFTDEETKNILEHSEASAIFVSESLYSKLKDVADNIIAINIENFTLFQSTGKMAAWDPEKNQQ